VFTLAIVLIGSALAVPAPLVTQAQGVIWPGEQARVVSITDGFVVEVAKEAGAEVTLGDVLLRLDNPELRTRLEVVKRRLQELRNEQIAERQRSRVRAAIVADDIAAVRAEYDQLVTSLAGLEIRSAEEGRFYPADPHELIGKYLRQGDVVGYVIRAASPVVRAIVEQDRVGLLRSHNTQVEVVLAERLGQPLPAEVVREIPAGSEELPSMALGAAGGGDIAVDTRDQAGRTATEKVFQLELALPSYARATGIGGRAYVRLDHGSEPLWRQWTRSIRQLLLSRLQT
jgi:putative peptide zinc metalloprotease protein